MFNPQLTCSKRTLLWLYLYNAYAYLTGVVWSIKDHYYWSIKNILKNNHTNLCYLSRCENALINRNLF